MRISSIRLAGFRNFASSTVALANKTLLIGGNDVGKTNMFYALRLLLDRSIAETELAPRESDFHVPLSGSSVSTIRIEVWLADIVEDAVISRLKGHVSEEGACVLTYSASRADLSYTISIGHSLDASEEVDSRYYLKHIHFHYVESSRNLEQYIQKEKRNLLRISKEKRTPEEQTADSKREVDLEQKLTGINEGVNRLNYVAGATRSINSELKNISRHHATYEVGLESPSVNFSVFVERLRLAARSGGRRVGLGGDGRNNQILVGLWKAKSEIEHDVDNEAVVYCIEEPEAHLHPHQQRKLADYLVKELRGQVLVSTHSPQIASEFCPDGIVRLFERHGHTEAASGGCSACVEGAWKALSYRMSILPAEAFFSDAVLLVEGPSEVLFYHELAAQLDVDLDYHNVSVLAVDGVDFQVYVTVLNALEIPWVLRTDNDVSKVPRSDPPKWRFAGLNRALKVLGKAEVKDAIEKDLTKLATITARNTRALNKGGIYLSSKDLEHDLGQACGTVLMEYAGVDILEEAIAYLQARKATRMCEFLLLKASSLAALKDDALEAPLRHAVQLAEHRRALATSPGRQRRGRD